MCGWATVPPPLLHQDINIDFPFLCVGIVGDQLIGPADVSNRLIGSVYHHFLMNELPVLLEHGLLRQQQHMWFMHDGASTYFLCIVREHLNQASSEQWIGVVGPFN
jgi:hypothetical protein